MNKKKNVKLFTEGKRLADVSMSLNVPKHKIILLDHGTNTGKNIYEFAAEFGLKFKNHG